LGKLPGGAGGVLLDGDDVRDAAAGFELAAHSVAGGLRGDQDDVNAFRGLDVAEADVEAVGEGQGLARGQLVLDGVGVDRALVLVRRQDHDDVGPLGGVGNVLDREACVLGLGDGLGAFLKRDDNLDTGIAQVLRVGVALGAVADNGYLAALDDRQVCVVVVKHFSHLRNSS
jgi:hypothetical protein